MSEEFATELLRHSLVQIVHNHGFNAASNFSLDVLLDVYSKYLKSFCSDLRHISDGCDRTGPLLDDVGLVLRQKGSSFKELCDYMQQVEPVPFPCPVPAFPVAAASHDKPLFICEKASDNELAERPQYLDPWLPATRPPSAPPSADQPADEPDGLPADVDGKPVDPDDNAGRKPTSETKPGPIRTSNRRTTDRMRRPKAAAGIHIDDLPDFTEMDAFSLGLVQVIDVPKPPPPPIPVKIAKPRAVPAPPPPMVHRAASNIEVAMPKLTLKLPPRSSVSSSNVLDHSLEDGEIEDDQVTTPLDANRMMLAEYSSSQSASNIKPSSGSVSSTRVHDTSIEDAISNVLSAALATQQRSAQPPLPSTPVTSHQNEPKLAPLSFASLIPPSMLSSTAASAESVSRQTAGDDKATESLRLQLRQVLPKTREKFNSKEKLKARIHERKLEKERKQKQLEEHVARSFVPLKPSTSKTSTPPSRPSSSASTASASGSRAPSASMSVKIVTPSGRPPSGAKVEAWEREQKTRTPTPTKALLKRARDSDQSSNKSTPPAPSTSTPSSSEKKIKVKGESKLPSGPGHVSPIKPFKFKLSRLTKFDTAATAYIKKKKKKAKQKSEHQRDGPTAAGRRQRSVVVFEHRATTDTSSPHKKHHRHDRHHRRKRSSKAANTSGKHQEKIPSFKMSISRKMLGSSDAKIKAKKVLDVEPVTPPSPKPESRASSTDGEPDTKPVVVVLKEPDVSLPASSLPKMEDSTTCDAKMDSPVVVMTSNDRHSSISPAVSPHPPPHPPAVSTRSTRSSSSKPASRQPSEQREPTPKLIPKLKIKLGGVSEHSTADMDAPGRSRSPSVCTIGSGSDLPRAPSEQPGEQKVAPMRLSLKGLYSRVGNTSSSSIKLDRGKSPKASSAVTAQQRSRTTTMSSARGSTRGRDSTGSPAPLTPSPRSISPGDSPLRVQIGSDEVLPSPTGGTTSTHLTAMPSLTSPLNLSLRLVSPADTNMPKTPAGGTPSVTTPLNIHIGSPDFTGDSPVNSQSGSNVSSRASSRATARGRGGRRSVSTSSKKTPSVPTTPTGRKMPPLSIKLKKPTHPAAKRAKRTGTGGGSTSDDSWICPICNVAYKDGVEMIACDKCDRWFHWCCVGIIQPPPDNQKWYCKYCANTSSSNTSTPTKPNPPSKIGSTPSTSKSRKGSSSSVSSAGSKRAPKR